MKIKMNLISIIVLTAILCFSCVSISFASEDRSDEVNQYISRLESQSRQTRINALKVITRSNLTDPRLFNVIRDKLLEGYELETYNTDHVDEMAWLCKALASSGLSDYKETLKTVSENAYSMKLKGYANQSLELVDDYATKNQVVTDTAHFDESLSPEINRYISMLKSDDLRLKKDAAKMIYRSDLSETKLFDAISDELLEGYKANGADNIDTMAWFCKALGSSGISKYQATLDEVLQNTTNIKLKKYAKKGLNNLK